VAYIGITCDRSRQEERPYITRAECDECVQHPDHPCPFHGKLLRAMWGDDDREPNGLAFSPTRLLGCPRAKYLERHSYDQILDPYKKWNAVRGNMSHSFLEQLPPAPGTCFEISEVRFETIINTKYGPQKLVGKPDLIEVLGDDGDKMVVKITDWKSTKEIRHDFLQAKEAHQKQVNMYALILYDALPGYLFRPGLEVIVDELEIVYFDMGRVRRFTSGCSLIDRGKLLTPRRAGNHEQLKLMSIKHKAIEDMRKYVALLIEDAIDASERLYPPLQGDEAKLCSYCPFYRACWNLFEEKGV
jgi:hypothetical protein